MAVKSRDGRRRANDFVELLDVRKEHVARDLAAQEDGVGRREFCRRAREIVLQEVDALDLSHVQTQGKIQANLACQRARYVGMSLTNDPT